MNSSMMQPVDHVSYLRDQALLFSVASGGSYLQVVNLLHVYVSLFFLRLLDAGSPVTQDAKVSSIWVNGRADGRGRIDRNQNAK